MNKKLGFLNLKNAKWVGLLVAAVAGIGAFTNAVQEQKQAERLDNFETRIKNLENK